MIKYNLDNLDNAPTEIDRQVAEQTKARQSAKDKITTENKRRHEVLGHSWEFTNLR
jgi:hypothetical protein